MCPVRGRSRRDSTGDSGQSGKVRGRARAAPVPLDRFPSVAGTARMEAAVGAEQWTHCVSIQRDESDQERAHRSLTRRQCTARLAVVSACVAVAAAGRAFTTRSTIGNSCWCWRKYSRIRRLRRLRPTAPPAARTPTARPRRGCPRPFNFARTRNSASEERRPCAVHGIELGLCEQPQGARQTARRLMNCCGGGGQVRPRGACGPWRDGG